MMNEGKCRACNERESIIGNLRSKFRVNLKIHTFCAFLQAPRRSSHSFHSSKSEQAVQCSYLREFFRLGATGRNEERPHHLNEKNDHLVHYNWRGREFGRTLQLGRVHFRKVCEGGVEAFGSNMKKSNDLCPHQRHSPKILRRLLSTSFSCQCCRCIPSSRILFPQEL